VGSAARSVSALAVAALFCARGAEASHADVPVAPSAFWPGLAPTTEAGRGQAIALRPPLGGRVRVPGGVFVMGSTATQILDGLKLCQRELAASTCEKATAFQTEGLAHEVTLSTFYLDRTEVTVGAYNQCVAAGVCAPSGAPVGDPRFTLASLPVTFVRWDDARAYCEWAGGRLPTEAEWEYAARGTSSRAFPWGNVYNSHLCNHGALAEDETDASDGFAYLAPVGSYPDGASPLGLLDLAGNASEWVSDVWGEPDENGNGYSAKPQVNPKGPAHGGFHVIRGGSFTRGGHDMRAAARHMTVMPRAPDVGFRCAADAR
jgi:sulfatase modifying factor 1